MTLLADAAARERIRTSLGETLVVEAAAGTGKTSEIVRRIAAVLGRGVTTADRVVALTFTVKAAGELKLRVRAELDRTRVDAPPDEARRLDAALRELEHARIHTIHGFCAELLAEYPVAARVDPTFATLDDPARDRLYREVFSSWLERALEQPGPGLRRALHRFAAEDSPTEALLAAGRTMLEWRDYATPWRRDPFERGPAIDTVATALRALADLVRLGTAADPLFRACAPAGELHRDVERLVAAVPRPDDALEALLARAAADRDFVAPARGGRGTWYAAGVTRQAVVDAHAVFLTALLSFARAANADLAALLHGELAATMLAFEAATARSGHVDFLDLLLRAREVLRGDAGVRRQLQERFSHLFIDEFQDTDSVQAEVLLLLAADDSAEADWRRTRPVPGKLFLVGDPKQSIYRFRRADVAAYREVRDLLVARGATLLTLETNFRTVPAIQRVVNAAFAGPMAEGAPHQCGYVPLRPDRPALPGQPAVVALPIPHPFGPSQQPTKKCCRQSQPQAVAAFLQWLLTASGWRVTGRDGAPVPVAPQHVCLLFKQFVDYRDDLTRPYLDALEARDLPHLLVGGRALHDREEIGTVRAALRAIEDPGEDLALYATLRGSLFGLSDLVLFEYRSRTGRITPFRIPEALPTHLVPVADALRIVLDLHRRRNRRPIAETLGRLLETTRAYAGFAFRPNGEQVLANVLLVLELARAYDTEGALSFRGFVERLEDSAERREATEAPTLEEGSEGIRLMTVHKAKGLEFPVVVLADLATNHRPSRARRWVDAARGLCAFPVLHCDPIELVENASTELAQEEAETVRLAYVAATRARDLLVVPVIGDRVWRDKWLTPLCAALPQPPQAPWAHAPGCPPFGPSTVLGGGGGIRPGRYVVPRDEAPLDVTWWDPACVADTRTPRFGLRAKVLLDPPEDATVVGADVAAFHAWEQARQMTRDTAATPSRVVAAVTRQPSPTAEAACASVVVVALGYEGPRGSGARFGTLVHEVLASVPLAAPTPEIEGLCTFHGRRLGAPEEERQAAAALVRATLAHGILLEAAAADAAGACYREVPVTLDRDGVLHEGVVDLAYRTDARWWVVDFKTDAEVSANVEAYTLQVATYVEAVAAATGEDCRGVLFAL